ncbi:hypothetical protein GON26_06245 [Flavobacterium sp. GA093]|uniref:Uncharacterized protein n=1 Tax=Flavobacterium hydrocarbonoxydans TaxID=2683249 RepID=A0A6I4NN48_9FLAO|nr:hypothetical protein [Flavobacterium hydrocarbonoxydans]MWB93955.1 hypothetical protein [Flavobacterium hydrocarbonoxydans]
MKKYITSVNIAFFLWGLILVAISEISKGEYTRNFLYFSIIVIIPIMIFNLIKKRKEDKRNDTSLFRESIYRMLIVVIMLGIAFYITIQNRM